MGETAGELDAGAGVLAPGEGVTSGAGVTEGLGEGVTSGVGVGVPGGGLGGTGACDGDGAGGGVVTGCVCQVNPDPCLPCTISETGLPTPASTAVIAPAETRSTMAALIPSTFQCRVVNARCRCWRSSIATRLRAELSE